ncbi:MAG: GNAT family N-acetyltransferase [Bacteroidota bacterium]|nr:GNAT family N-acetyltransferase [Bacteroidota bacterium]
MSSLSLNITEQASEFTEDQWRAWDEFLSCFEDSSIHLSAGVIRAGLKSPARQVMAAMWTDSSAQIQGVAVMEDSEAISQGVDDFLEGTRGFKWAKNWLHREGGFRFGVRVIGTPLASGPHGYRFAEGIDAHTCLLALLAQPAMGGKASVPGTWVVKDAPSAQPWANGHRHAGKSSWRAGWVDLEFDPVMRVSLEGRASWDDYLADMRTKARTKVKRILKLSESLTFTALGLEDIRAQADDLHMLYLKVYGRSAFRLGCLHPEDLVTLKEELGEGFQVWTSELEGEVIGFHCGMCNGQEVEAFFVGFEGSHNKSHALYQRMLVEFIRWGIQEGCAVVNLGRTALDIKASLGAEPQRLVLHQRMRNPLIHGMARWAARASAPKQGALKRAWREEAPVKANGRSVHHEVVSASVTTVA